MSLTWDDVDDDALMSGGISPIFLLDIWYQQICVLDTTIGPYKRVCKRYIKMISALAKTPRCNICSLITRC